jgi:glucan 1,3-beta-glucosidase
VVSSLFLVHVNYSDTRTAPYSQNGFDNSGQRGGIGWGQGDSISRTIQALNKIRDDMGSHPAVSTIELLNEPMGSSIGMDKVRQFYMDGWGNLRDTNLVVTFHDAFAGVNAWNDWGSGMWNLMLDTVSILQTSSSIVLY